MKKLNRNEIIAIIRGVEASVAPLIVKVLIEEGITWIEVSLSNEELGLECIKEISKSIKSEEINLGVGTVINTNQVDEALEAGAKYIITPGWDRELVRYIKKKNVMVLPGVFSPSDVMQAKNEDIAICKLYPASTLSLNYAKSLLGPFPDVSFVAVGGVRKSNINDYLDNGFFAAGVGSDLVPRGARKEDLEIVRNNAREYIKLISTRDDSIE